MAGSVPQGVEEWLADRREGPLPAGVLVRYERISKGKATSSNGAIAVHQDGRVTGSGPVYKSGRLGGILKRGRLRLDEGELAKLRTALATLEGTAPYQRDEVVKGGDFEVVSRASGDPAVIVFDHAERDVLADLRDVARRAQPDAS